MDYKRVRRAAKGPERYHVVNSLYLHNAEQFSNFMDVKAPCIHMSGKNVVATDLLIMARSDLYRLKFFTVKISNLQPLLVFISVTHTLHHYISKSGFHYF